MTELTQEEEKRQLDFYIKHESEILYSECNTSTLLQGTLCATNKHSVFKHSDKSSHPNSGHCLSQYWATQTRTFLLHLRKPVAQIF